MQVIAALAAALALLLAGSGKHVGNENDAGDMPPPPPEPAAAPAVVPDAPVVGAGLPFNVPAGRRVTLAYVDGRFHVIRAEAAPPVPEAPPAPKGADAEHMLELPGVTFGAEEDTLVFTFWDQPATGGQLKLENGLSRPVIYSAQIIYGSGRRSPTTICSVGSRRVGVEAWPDDLAAIQITGIYDAPPGQKVCGYPENGRIGPAPSAAP